MMLQSYEDMLNYRHSLRHQCLGRSSKAVYFACKGKQKVGQTVDVGQHAGLEHTLHIIDNTE